MRVAELYRARGCRYQVSVGRKPYIASQAKVVVIVIRNSFADNSLKDHAVFGVAQTPGAGKRSSDSGDVPGQIWNRRVRDNSAHVAEEGGSMKMAMLILKAVKANQVRKLRRSDGRAERSA